MRVAPKPSSHPEDPYDSGAAPVKPPPAVTAVPAATPPPPVVPAPTTPAPPKSATPPPGPTPMFDPQFDTQKEKGS